MNNTVFLMAFALIAGALIPLQLIFNGQLGGVTKNAFTASLIVFLIGALTLCAIVLALRPTFPALAELASAPKTIWLGGLIATFYIIAVVVVTPRLGVGLTVSLILIAQLASGMALDHFGVFGNPQRSLTLLRGLGLAMMVGGIVLIRKM
jgi:bacterial/archaeal transporter family-2 protein